MITNFVSVDSKRRFKSVHGEHDYIVQAKTIDCCACIYTLWPFLKYLQFIFPMVAVQFNLSAMATYSEVFLAYEAEKHTWISEVDQQFQKCTILPSFWRHNHQM